jgi:hypothetical protein
MVFQLDEPKQARFLSKLDEHIEIAVLSGCPLDIRAE